MSGRQGSFVASIIKYIYNKCIIYLFFNSILLHYTMVINYDSNK